MRRTTTTTTTTTASRTTKERSALFKPDLYYTSVLAIDLTELRGRGVTALLVDVDNTVSPHHSSVVLPEMHEWLASVQAAGFGVRLVSNNWHADLEERARALGAGVVGKARKPLTVGFRRAARELGVTPRECAVVGDQIFTDILGGDLFGATTVLVRPVSHEDLPHTRVLRRLERVIMNGRAPEA